MPEILPIAVATAPATMMQRRIAAVVIVIIIIAAGSIAPSASRPLLQIDAFIPAVQTVLSVADLITAVLLFAQYSVLPARSLLALASAYISSACFAFAQTLSFPGSYAATGIIGDGNNSPAWLFVFWHVTFPAGVLVYTILKEMQPPGPLKRGSLRPVVVTVVWVSALILFLAWLATGAVQHLPAFYTTDIVQQTRLANQINVGLALWYSVVLVVLLARRRTILDVWLVVILVAWLPNFVVAAATSSVRFSVGWYAGRGFALVASFLLLIVLLTEMVVLYSRLRTAFALLRREQDNRLSTVDAATAALAHEIRQPLTAILNNAEAGLLQLHSPGAGSGEIESILQDITKESSRAGEILASIRAVFKSEPRMRVSLLAGDIANEALRLVEPELRASRVIANLDMRDNMSRIFADGTQLQQVLVNLIRNAIDAMISNSPHRRNIQLSTRRRDNLVVFSIVDTGSGVPTEITGRVFDAFFTTKSTGAGLGLAISRTIVEAHGGLLQLVSSTPKGSVFEVSVPVHE